MINIEVFSEEKAWSKKLKKKEIFFKKICSSFPKKYQFPNKKINLTLLLSNNKCIRKLNKILEIKINLLIFYHFLLIKKLRYLKKLILETL
tara:strand:- start:2443 stop:2715 length:273 start_codon:yes stop_codon:yes gene_type:complete